MKFGVVTFPGSNCDMDMVHALEHDLGFPLFNCGHKDHDLQGADVIVLPGGFSYGDYLRNRAIARFSPIVRSVVNHAKKAGRVFGVCNGFQILCETGLLPGALLAKREPQVHLQKRRPQARLPKGTSLSRAGSFHTHHHSHCPRRRQLLH